jgi:hypothetical protein
MYSIETCHQCWDLYSIKVMKDKQHHANKPYTRIYVYGTFLFHHTSYISRVSFLFVLSNFRKKCGTTSQRFQDGIYFPVYVYLINGRSYNVNISWRRCHWRFTHIVKKLKSTRWQEDRSICSLIYNEIIRWWRRPSKMPLSKHISSTDSSINIRLIRKI